MSLELLPPGQAPRRTNVVPGQFVTKCCGGTGAVLAVREGESEYSAPTAFRCPCGVSKRFGNASVWNNPPGYRRLEQ